MFNKKFDSLHESVAKVMADNQIRRNVEAALNEEIGIFNKKALPHEYHAEYDSVLASRIDEALKGNQHRIDADGDKNITTRDFKLLGNKKAGSMEEQEVNTAAKSDMLASAPAKITTLKPLNKPGLPKLGGMTVAQKGVMKEEEALDEVLDTPGKKLGYVFKNLGSSLTLNKKTRGKRKEGERLLRGKMEKDKSDKEMSDYRNDKAREVLDNMGKSKKKVNEALDDESARETGVAYAKAWKAKKLDEFITMPNNKPDPLTSFRQRQVDQTGAAIKKYTDTIQDPAKKAATQTFVGGAQKAAEPVLKKQGLQPAPTSLAPKLPVRPGQQNSGPAKPDTSMGAGRAAERNVVSPPKTTTPPPPPKPGATGRTIQGPAGTTATMTGRGTDAIVKNKSGTYAGSVVKNRFGGQTIQNFRAGGGTPMGPKGK